MFLLIARIDAYYSYLEDINYGPYTRVPEDLSWLPIAFWQMVLSVIASLAAHRYIRPHRWSPFLLWQIIGTIGLLGWSLTLFSLIGLEWLMHGDERGIRLLSTIEIATLGKYVSTVFASHVIYGSAMHASSREYLDEKTDNLSEGSVVLMAHRSFKKGPKQ